mmetsp:Transcript_13328/g.39698  ORF Transcript_13328/g.39698 Transcript_13328/m.39698 type:complete len:179 (+) Transcript_13328:415-951(+)
MMRLALCVLGASAALRGPAAFFGDFERPLGDDDSECDVLLCGGSGVGKSTLLHNIRADAVNHTCPVPRAWSAFERAVRDKRSVVRHVDTCNLPCSGCGRLRVRMTADRAALVAHWTDRVAAGFKGGLGYALRKTMWTCRNPNQWGGASLDPYDLHVNVDAAGRYCVRTGHGRIRRHGR